MAIAEVKPAGHLTIKLGGMPIGTELYTEEQVREILIKFINGVELDGLNSIKIMYENGLNNTAKLIETDIIDEFVESGK